MLLQLMNEWLYWTVQVHGSVLCEFQFEINKSKKPHSFQFTQIKCLRSHLPFRMNNFLFFHPRIAQQPYSAIANTNIVIEKHAKIDLRWYFRINIILVRVIFFARLMFAVQQMFRSFCHFSDFFLDFVSFILFFFLFLHKRFVFRFDSFKLHLFSDFLK